jgi:hypothetical protein
LEGSGLAQAGAYSGGPTQFDLLTAGEIDAGITTGTWAPNVHPDVDFLFPNYAELERDYSSERAFFRSCIPC